jgi:hypothetical protein
MQNRNAKMARQIGLPPVLHVHTFACQFHLMDTAAAIGVALGASGFLNYFEDSAPHVTGGFEAQAVEELIQGGISSWQFRQKFVKSWVATNVLVEIGYQLGYIMQRRLQ